MAPIVHGLEDIYSDQINFVYLDIDNPETETFKRTFGYRYQPEYYLVGPQGEVLQSWFGFVPPEAFLTVFEDTLSQQ
jgi:thioredoxin-related protein